MGNILVLEDDEGIASLISTYLERGGHLVKWLDKPDDTTNPAEFDLLIMDYKLSGNYSGLDFYKKIRAEGITLPAILVTGFADEKILAEALRAGVRDFLPKNQKFWELLPLTVERVMHDVERERELDIARRMQVHNLETHHRVKNSFQIVRSLLNMELRKHEVLDKDSVAKVVSHLQGLSLIHDILTEKVSSNQSSASITTLELIEPLTAILQGSDEDRSIISSVDSVLVEPKVASSLAVVVTELLINALKYGSGQIELCIKALPDNTALLLMKNQISTEQTDKKVNSSTGSELVEFLARSDFKSALKKEISADGYYSCELTFPTLEK